MSGGSRLDVSVFRVPCDGQLRASACRDANEWQALVQRGDDAPNHDQPGRGLQAPGSRPVPDLPGPRSRRGASGALIVQAERPISLPRAVAGRRTHGEPRRRPTSSVSVPSRLPETRYGAFCSCSGPLRLFEEVRLLIFSTVQVRRPAVLGAGSAGDRRWPLSGDGGPDFFRPPLQPGVPQAVSVTTRDPEKEARRKTTAASSASSARLNAALGAYAASHHAQDPEAL